MRFNGQSAVEFLTTYSFAFLVIGVALALLYVFSSIPASTLPTQCTFYNGFSSSCDALYYNTSSGANLTVIATDAQPGVLNVSSFSAYINFGVSTSGSCAPTVALDGQTIYCTANLAQKPNLGSIYTGTFDVKANYCANSPSNISNATCPSSTTFVYPGSIRLQAAPYHHSGIFVVPITVTNSQTGAAQGPFQQMIQFVPNSYVSRENGNLGNIRFYYGNRELASWCEANCTNSSTHIATFWVKLPSGIPASSSVVVNMYVLPKSVNYDGLYAGEAPQLSPSYAKYDNGANVFNFYDNFNGTSINKGFWNVVGTVTADNGISIATATSYIYSIGAYSPPLTVDVYGDPYNGGAGEIEFSGLNKPVNSGKSTIEVGGGGSTYGVQYTGSAFVTTSSFGSTDQGKQIWSDSIVSSSNAIFTENYNNAMTLSSDAPSYPLPIFIGNNGGSNPSATITATWVRTRTPPPSGVMPSISIGSISQLQ